MIITKCPLRVSLVGGSTDLQAFLDRYGKGSVISFPSNLHVYIAIHDNNRNEYIINYFKTERVKKIADIKNDVARIVLEHFNVGPITVSFQSDIVSTGSGLASSTAYMICLIKALSIYTKQNLTEYEVCKKAIELERLFNTETGHQDSYGCGIGGFKRIDFSATGEPSFKFLSSEFLRNNFDMALYHTGISRSSTKILKTIDVEKSFSLLEQVDLLENSIKTNDVNIFLSVFNKSWLIKKATSSFITDSKKFKKWDKAFEIKNDILGVKLLGAGGGGYFLAISKKGCLPKTINGSPAILIQVNEQGLESLIF